MSIVNVFNMFYLIMYINIYISICLHHIKAEESVTQHNLDPCPSWLHEICWPETWPLGIVAQDWPLGVDPCGWIWTNFYYLLGAFGWVLGRHWAIVMIVMLKSFTWWFYFRFYYRVSIIFWAPSAEFLADIGRSWWLWCWNHSRDDSILGSTIGSVLWSSFTCVFSLKKYKDAASLVLCFLCSKIMLT